MKIADQVLRHGVDLTCLSSSPEQRAERGVQLNRVLKYFESQTEEEIAKGEPLTHDLQSGGALLRCAHCHERQTEWHLHRPSL